MGGRRMPVHEGQKTETAMPVPAQATAPALASRPAVGPWWRPILALGLLAVSGAVALTAWTAGHALAVRQRESIRASVTPYLQAVVDFRASELSRWLAERKGDAE